MIQSAVKTVKSVAERVTLRSWDLSCIVRMANRFALLSFSLALFARAKGKIDLSPLLATSPRSLAAERTRAHAAAFGKRAISSEVADEDLRKTATRVVVRRGAARNLQKLPEVHRRRERRGAARRAGLSIKRGREVFCADTPGVFLIYKTLDLLPACTSSETLVSQR